MAHLILVRHGHSAWNKLDLWTGHTDVPLAEEGYAEARRAGEALRDITIHTVHVSHLIRTHETARELLRAHGTETELLPYAALNERHYGVHTGKNKWEIKAMIGENAFTRIRRGWNEPIPEGETLKDVHARVVPHYQTHVLSHLRAGRNVLVVSHGNTLRALIKHLDALDTHEVEGVEVATGSVHCYEIDSTGSILRKEVRS